MKKSTAALRLDRLHQFHQVATHGSLKAAARALRISPPAVTHALARLEADLEAVLCIRGRGRFALTEAGRKLYASTRRIFDEVDVALSALDTARPFSGVLSLGIQNDLVDPRLDAALERLLARHPDSKLALRVGAPEELTRLLLRGELHAALGIFFRRSERIRYVPVAKQRLAYFVSDRHPLFAARRVGRSQLVGQRVAWVDAEARDPHALEHEVFGAHRGYKMHVAAYSNSLQGGLRILLSGRAVVPLPETWAARALAPFSRRVRRLRVRTRAPVFEVSCAFDPTRPAVPPLREFLAQLDQRFAQGA